MLPKYLDNAEEGATIFLTNSIMSVMDRLSAASLIAAHSEDTEEDEEDNDKDLMAPDDGYGDFTNRHNIFARDNIWIIATEDTTKAYLQMAPQV